MEIGTVVTTVVKAIEVAKTITEVIAPKLQESMKAFSERMITLSEKYPSIEEFAQIIYKAADIMGDVLFVLGINAEPSDVIGLKSEQADKGIDDFETTEDYINYLRDEINLDKEKYDSLSEGEKLAYSINGMAIEAGAISEKLGVDIPADAVELVAKIADIGKIVIDAKELVTIITDLKEDGINDLNDICDFVQGIGDSDRDKTADSLVDSIEKIHPGDGNKIVHEMIDEARE